MKILILLGAGSSVDSGIPTFSGKTKGNFNINFFNIDFVKQNPQISNNFFNKIKKEFNQAQSNNYHNFLDYLNKNHIVDIISQNIDHLDLNYNTIKIHGELNKSRCLNNQEHNIQFRKIGEKCPVCETNIIPNVLLYGEKYKKHIIAEIKNILKQDYDYFFIIGSSLKLKLVNQIINNVKADFNININPEIEIKNKGFFNYKTLEEYKQDLIMVI